MSHWIVFMHACEPEESNFINLMHSCTIAIIYLTFQHRHEPDIVLVAIYIAFF